MSSAQLFLINILQHLNDLKLRVKAMGSSIVKAYQSHNHYRESLPVNFVVIICTYSPYFQFNKI